MKPVSLALAGNPNSGKTTLFNALTGGRQRVGNYPGVTVERKEGTVESGGRSVHVIDLPGAYSLTAYSPEEIVARQVIVEERPGAVVQIIDSTVLERSLYLTVQLLELGAPVVLALNMMDEVRRKGLRIDSGRLSRLLGLPVVETVARTGQGKDDLLREAVDFASTRKEGQGAPLVISYGRDVDEALEEMTVVILQARLLMDRYPARWTALKYLETDGQVLAEGRASDPATAANLEEMALKTAIHCRESLNADPESIIADYRYGWVKGLLRQGVLTRDFQEARRDYSEKIDLILTHRLLVAVLYGVFKLTFAVGEIPMGWLESLFGWLSATAEAALPESLFRSLLVSGVIDGVGGVLGFVPLIAMMFVAVTFLEDLGYMARAAYMLDRLFRLFGLHGSSVMPFLISGGLPGGCAVPGVMAARTLVSPKERIATLLTAPFMACGAKVPVFVLLAAAFFPGQEARVMFLVTLGGWVAALLVARLLRSTLLRGEPLPFVMELPPYRLPTLRGVLIHAWERAWQYIKKAGTVILAVSILLWAGMTFPGLPDSRTEAFEAMRQEAVQSLPQEQWEEALAEIDNQEAEEALRYSLAGRIGAAFEPLSRAAGFDWRTNIALVGGFAAKEVVVSTLGTAYSLGEVDVEESASLSERLAADPGWSAATALALMVFTLLYAPCFVTVAAMAKESSWRWATLSMAGNTVLAFLCAVLIYQGMTALG